ncbi:polysaccharide lyase 6 family protein [Actinocrispum sp. NPDC049592]|uniref:polysaccharide lyase 6 family protein n=1 Tax=Actinocrispum sp. NPDC049592 TaxID=3154835 RepID=UPI0034183251
MRKLALVVLPLLGGLFVGVPASAATVRVTSLSALQNAVKSANPGDRIELADGSYSASSAISLTRSGTSSAPITVTAANVGKAEIRGSTGFSFGSGVHDVVLSGFSLRHGGSLSVPANGHHIQITRNTLQFTSSGNWLTINGNDVQVDHNTFQNRSTEGVFLQIAGPDSDVAKRTWIHHNYFFNHTFGGANGGESIRLGYSHKQSYSANAIVEYNLFEKANGDSEAISVKSSDNTVRYNTIRDSRGYIVLRHGNRSTVEGNLIFGASGIRFHGNDHKIINNYVDSSAGRAIVFGSGSEADSSPTSKGHDRPDRVTVAFNTVRGTSAVIDSDGGDFKPKDCVLANNIIVGTSGKLVNMTSGATVKYEGNITWGGSSAGIPSGGYKNVDPKLTKDANGLYRLTATSPAIDASTGTYPYVTTDFDPQPRTNTPDTGADEYATAATRKPLTKSDVGPLAP